jgi:hypothetical protein
VGQRRVYIVDRCFGKSLAESLRHEGFDARWLDDHFRQNTEDVDWIPKVTAKKWIILTKNPKIFQVTIEREVFIRCGARVFSFTEGQMRGSRFIPIVLGAMPAIEQFVDTHAGPFFVAIRPLGSLEMWYPPSFGLMPHVRHQRQVRGDPASEMDGAATSDEQGD